MAIPSGEATSSLAIAWRGHQVTVRQNDGHPEHYLWLNVRDKTFFLGTLQAGMTRGDVRNLAVKWLKAHPQHTN